MEARTTDAGHRGRRARGILIREYAGLWGFRVVCCDPPREEREHCGFLPLEEVAREADLLTFHTPLDTTTRHMAGEELFARLNRAPW